MDKNVCSYTIHNSSKVKIQMFINSRIEIIVYLYNVLKNWCFWNVVLEKPLESLLDWKEIKLVNPKGNQPWIFIGRTDAEAETPIFWPPNGKSWLIGKDPDAGKHSRQEEKGATENEMVGWHHQLNGHEFEQTPGDSEGQGNLPCWYSWGYLEELEPLSNSTTIQWLVYGDFGKEEHKILHVLFA